MEVYVNFNSGGLNLGNGGFKMMVNFSQGAAEIGHDVYLVDKQNRTSWDKLDWLAKDPQVEFDFQIGRFEDAADADRVVTPNIGPLLEDGELIGGISPEQLRKWDHDEVLTIGNEEATEFALEHLSKIAIFNRGLTHLYRDLGFRNIIYLDNWLREEHFHPPAGDERIADSIGYQSDSTRSDRLHPYLAPIIQRLPWYPPSLKRYRDERTPLTRYEPYRRLKSAFPDRDVILCEMPHSEDMAMKMRQSDLFLFFGADKGRYKDIVGEGFGLPLFEAMACGCACVAKRHDGNQFLEGVIPLVDTLDEAVDTLRQMNGAEREAVRQRGLEQIESRHRFDEEKIERMNELLA